MCLKCVSNRLTHQQERKTLMGRAGCVRVKRTSARVLFGSADGLLTNKLRMTGTEREQHKYRWCFWKGLSVGRRLDSKQTNAYPNKCVSPRRKYCKVGAMWRRRDAWIGATRRPHAMIHGVRAGHYLTTGSQTYSLHTNIKSPFKI